jgi:hypothetical protein
LLSLVIATMASMVTPDLAAGAGLFGSTPPWAVEAPGAAGQRFGLGLESFYERQESLRITESVRVITAGGHSINQGDDHDLLNRKFDLRFEQKGVGFLAPVALPSVRLAGGGAFHSTVFVRAATADVTLDFRDVTRSQDSTSLSGRGELFTVGADTVGSFCRGCPWFTAAGYRFEKLPSLEVERSPRLTLTDLEIARDEVTLERQVHEVSTRFGYAAPGGRVATFVGVVRRWTDIEVDDQVAFTRDGVETRLSSRTRLESEPTLGLAGVDVHLGPGLFGRLETSVGDEDYAVTLRMLYLGWGRKPAGTGIKEDEETREDTEIQEVARATAIAATMVEPLRRLEASLDRWRVCLNAGQCSAEEFLDTTEADLLEILAAPELAPLRDWAREGFREAREGLPAGTATGMRFASLRIQEQEESRAEVFERVLDLVREILGMAENQAAEKAPEKKKNGLLADLCVISTPVDGAYLLLWPRSERDNPDRQAETRTVGKMVNLYRGLYAYSVRREGYPTICEEGPGQPPCPRLNLVDDPQPVFECDLQASRCVRRAGPAGACDARR